MKFGLFHSIQWPQGSIQSDRYRQGIAEALLAERRGFDSVWLTEHHFTEHGIISDSLCLLAFLAAETEKVRLGTAVTVLPFHDPVRLAESAAMVDVLSNGRLDLGVGRGYQWLEFNGGGRAAPHCRHGCPMFVNAVVLAPIRFRSGRRTTARPV